MRNKRPWKTMQWRLAPAQLWPMTSAKNIFLFVVVPMSVLAGFWPWLLWAAVGITLVLLLFVWIKR
ncbi:MAG: hypothetical protein EHM35_02260 [Planctomycetaceae bacterium]|nr:MAG: hypothetical protein EHM35_02260 [Planctomycetaceae bacterium]